MGAVYADHLQLSDLAGEDAKGLDGVDGAADGGRVHGQVQTREHVGGWEVSHLRRDGHRLLLMTALVVNDVHTDNVCDCGLDC